MNEHYVGASLLFAKREDQILEAILKSYVLKSNTYQEAIEEAKAIGAKQNIYRKFEYIGIEDVFRVVGPIEDGALLGRMTIWEQTLQNAKDLVLEPDKFTFSTQLNGFSGKWYLATPIYFVQAEDTEDSRSISCYCLIENSMEEIRSLIIDEEKLQGFFKNR